MYPSKSRSTLLVLLATLAISALALVLSGCGAKEPAFDIALGQESDQAIYVTNATGQDIVGICVAEEGTDAQGNLLDEGASIAVDQAAKIFIAAGAPDEVAAPDDAVPEEPAEEAAPEEAPDADAPFNGGLAEDVPADEGNPEEGAGEAAQPAPLYNIQITFADGTTATLYGFDPRTVSEFSLCFEDEVAFLTYTNDSGDEVSTKDEALAIKAELDRIAAEEAAAAEAEAWAAQQQNYYANPYSADTSASQGQSGCLGLM